jgi:DNA modification methylase
MTNVQLTLTPVRELRPYQGNARTHSKKQIRQIANSIERFGFTNPVLISDDNEIIAGHGRVAAAKLLGITAVPTVKLSHLSPAERRAYVIADNKLALNAGWDREVLAIELQGLIDMDFDVELTGFEPAEIDLVIGEAAEKAEETGPEDTLPPADGPVVSRPGDLWLLGEHRLLCGDARDENAYRALLGEEVADLVFTDPPYNVKIHGHVSGLGKVRHEEFAMASGEMKEGEFIAFLSSFLKATKASVKDGAILFVCIDWAHVYELQTAGRQAGLTLKNICVWNKSNGGMGTFYRSKHELVLAYKAGEAPHTNNFELGQHGRNRTNVWDYAGVNTFRSDRMDELAMHPTVKPVGLVADAIKDCSKRREIVLDPFSGSGTTLIAAEKTGRRGRAIEYAPKYVDVAIRRWQAFTGKQAVLVTTGQSFEDTEEERSAHPAVHVLEAA